MYILLITANYPIMLDRLIENLNLPSFLERFLPVHAKFSLDDVPPLDNKVALVTGGSEGIGYGCLHELLKNNIAKIFLLSNRKEIFKEMEDDIRKSFGDQGLQRIRWIECNLTKWESDVVQAAETVSKETERLDVVIMAAARGVMTCQKDAHGCDLHMSTNHVGHTLLLERLLPLLKKTAESYKQGEDRVRIAIIASRNHRDVPTDLSFKDEGDFDREMAPSHAYARSKLANILFARYWAARLPANVVINATHPGLVDTAQTNVWIHEPFPVRGYLASVFLYPLKKSPFEACRSTLYAATKTMGTAQYINVPAQIEPGSDKSNDRSMGERLMDITQKKLKSAGL